MTISPVMCEVTVPVEREVAFRRFTADIGSWWPMATHSVSEDRCREVRFGGAVGEAVTEVDADGALHEWGRIRYWQPPERVVFSWHPGRPESQETEVEVTFRAATDGAGTVVRLEHRGWEVLGDEGQAQRDAYSGGWVGVLNEYVDAMKAAV